MSLLGTVWNCQNNNIISFYIIFIFIIIIIIITSQFIEKYWTRIQLQWTEYKREFATQ